VAAWQFGLLLPGAKSIRQILIGLSNPPAWNHFGGLQLRWRQPPAEFVQHMFMREELFGAGISHGNKNMNYCSWQLASLL
jgi:hypothetical protein